MRRHEILKLVEKVNKNKKREKMGLFPLEFSDTGWRIVFPKSLELYDFCKEGKKLLLESFYDIDFKGGYYWIQYAPVPKRFTTPAIKLRYL